MDQYVDALSTRPLPKGISQDRTVDLMNMYEELKDEQRNLDFDDALIATLGMVSSEKWVADRIHEQFRFFVVDEYQILEAKSIGADCILLIAAALEPAKLKSLALFAKSLGLEVLLEVHDGEELEKSLCEAVDLVGINNRNLKTFEVSLEVSMRLVEQIPSSFLKISESGISDPSTLVTLKKAGFDGFLIGENFMKSARPEQAALNFMKEYRKLIALEA
jgi:hypothetical protein